MIDICGVKFNKNEIYDVDFNEVLGFGPYGMSGSIWEIVVTKKNGETIYIPCGKDKRKYEAMIKLIEDGVIRRDVAIPKFHER